MHRDARYRSLLLLLPSTWLRLMLPPLARFIRSLRPTGSAVGLLALLLALGWGTRAVEVDAQPEPFLRTAVQGDSAYVYHTERLPVGYGFHLYRKQGGETFTRVTDEPVRGIAQPQRLPAVLGDRYEWLRQRFDEDSPSGVYYTMRGDWTNGLFAAFIDPDIARALGLLAVDASAPVGEEVTYKVEFVNDRGEPTGESLETTAVLEPTAAPPPTELSASHEGREVTLAWSYPTSSRDEDDKVIRFDVYRMVGDDRAERMNGADVIVRNSAAESFRYDATVPRTGRSETFFVAAVDITGRVAARSDRLTYRVTDNVPPGPVGGVEVNDARSGEVQVTWSMPTAPDVAGYHVYRAPRLEAEFQRINDERLNLLETSYRDSTVTGRSSVHYRVAAVDSAGNVGEKSNAALAQVVDRQPPPAPEGLTARFVPQADSGVVRLTWSVDRIPADLDTYHVLRRRVKGRETPQSYAQVYTDRVQDTTALDRGVGKLGGFDDGATYRYAVAAIDSAKNISDTTFARLQIPDRTAPDPPAEVQATNEDGIRAVVTWSASAALDVDTYRVYRQPQRGDDSLWTSVSSPSTSVADDRVEAGRRYRYAVTAVDSVGNESERSAVAEIEMDDFRAPAAVRNVQAQEGPAGVIVRWEAVSADDVAGYRVYRTPNIPTGRYEAVSDTLVAEPPFTDAKGTSGAWYRVRAVDTAGNESRPSRPSRAVPPAE
jgi:fibronectin type 3 domain-containing protein